MILIEVLFLKKDNIYLSSQGYIFGTYLGDGNSHITINNNNNCESASCHWSFNINESNLDQDTGVWQLVLSFRSMATKIIN